MTKDEINVGDIVVCVNDAGSKSYLIAGRGYKVRKIFNAVNGMACINLDGLDDGGWYLDRFAKYDSFAVTFSLEEIEMAKEIIAECSR